MLGKEEIAGLEIVKPSIIFNGYLLIKRKTGKPIKIRFRGQQEFDRTAELMSAFFPEVVKITGEKTDKS